MTNTVFNELEHNQYHSEGWNKCVDEWDVDSPVLAVPSTKYTGNRRESFIEGFLAAQEYLILERAKTH